MLEKRGYAVDAPVIVKTLALSPVHLAEPGLGVQATVEPRPNAEWLTVAVDRGRYAGVRDVFLGIFARIGDRGG